jgi:hypothetical protein
LPVFRPQLKEKIDMTRKAIDTPTAGGLVASSRFDKHIFDYFAQLFCQPANLSALPIAHIAPRRY